MGALKSLVLVCGCALLFLMWWMPRRIEGLRDHGGGLFTPGSPSLEKALGSLMRSLIATFSIFSAIAAVFIGLPLCETRGAGSLALGIATFVLFSSGIVLSLYLALIRPLSGTAPTLKQCYWALRLLLVGLGFTMFTLASLL